MISMSELCKRRRIKAVDLATPMLVPSFSSKGFPDISLIWDNLKNYLIDTVLVSSYDIYYGHLGPKLEAASLLFVDSGGYEARKDYDLSEIYNMDYDPELWDREKHLEALRKLQTDSSLILISFDELGNQHELKSQIDTAQEFFSNFPGMGTNFLIKPSASNYLDLGEVTANVKLMSEFDLIGVTEKELGDSLASRLKSVVHLRLALSEAGLETPIHIFGCLDPISVWLFYLCGADVFDGLSWLRFVFLEDMPVYRNSWAALTGRATVSDHELFLLACLHNLQTLNRQRLAMIRFLDDPETVNLPLSLEELEAILNLAGVSRADRRV